LGANPGRTPGRLDARRIAHKSRVVVPRTPTASSGCIPPARTPLSSENESRRAASTRSPRQIRKSCFQSKWASADLRMKTDKPSSRYFSGCSRGTVNSGARPYGPPSYCAVCVAALRCLMGRNTRRASNQDSSRQRAAITGTTKLYLYAMPALAGPPSERTSVSLNPASLHHAAKSAPV
jgi:hypothetical protein